MKQKYIEKINLARKSLKNDHTLSEKELDERLVIGYNLMDELCATKDTEVLSELLDFFTAENDEWGGFSEHLRAQIGANFSLDQLIEAFYKKFDSFAGNCLEMCVIMSMICIRNRQINDGHWDRFRQMFNTVKSEHSGKILEGLKSWFTDTWTKEEKGMVYALEEDMKRWK
jgi:hypothetical protein